MSDQSKPDEFPKALSMHDVRGLAVGHDGRALRLEDRSGNGNHMVWAPGEGPLVTAGGGLVIDQSKPMAPVDHEPFEPMTCCGRERDKDGGRNPHCECPAELKPKPVAPEMALVASSYDTIRSALEKCR